MFVLLLNGNGKKDAFVSFYQNETLSEVNLSYLELPV
jgi:hypothetical protein